MDQHVMTPRLRLDLNTWEMRPAGHADSAGLCLCACGWCYEHHMWRATDGTLRRGSVHGDTRGQARLMPLPGGRVA